tara:strand:- start:1033 stop:1560 length:528 start_codon:yes stop_codon:yes gene_type:complete
MEVYIKQDPDNPSIKRPEYEGDAGYDLFARSEPKVSGEPVGKNSTLQATYKSINYIEYDTGLIIAPSNATSFYSMVYPRSSISKYNLSLANSVGVIDSGFRNSVKVRFRYLTQPEDLVIKEGKIIGSKINTEKIYRNGDKVAQIIWCMHNHPFLDFTDTLPPSERALGGFGSTGR